MARAATRPKPDQDEERPPSLIPEDDDLFTGLTDVEDFIKVLGYGKEGATKTTSACKMVMIDHPGKVLVVNVEGGLKKRALERAGVDTSKIVIWPQPGVKATRKGLDAALARVSEELDTDPKSWAGVVLDSGTETVQFILGGVQRKRVRNLVQQGRVPDPDFVDIADYGTTSKIVREFLRALRDMPCHVFITALERRDVDKDTKKPFYGPALPPALGTDILGYVDIVMAMKAPDEAGPARALCKESGRYRCKDRFRVLPRVLAEPTFPRVLAYVNGDLTEETDEVQKTLSADALKSMDATVVVVERSLDDDEDDDD